MSDRPVPCLFCRKAFRPGETVEHLIPEALGGWLKTRLICRSCNSMFGTTVDRVVDDQFFLHLRREVGLPVARDPEMDFFDPIVGAEVQGRLTEDRSVKPISPIYENEDGVIIRAESEEEAQRIIRKITDRLGRQGKSVSFHRIEGGDPMTVRMRRLVREPDQLITLLGREAAKIAVEYVARVAHPEIALLPALDDIRRYARNGEESPIVQIGYASPPSPFLLPQTRQIMFVGEDRSITPEATDAIVDGIVPEPSGGADPDLSAVPSWPSFVHQVALKNDGQLARLELTLFTSIIVTVALPNSLPLPWEAFDSKDLITGEITTYHPWGHPPTEL